jgi:hypothetical protein
MRRVSALILLAAVGVHSFGVNGKAVHQPTKTRSGPFTSTLPFPSPTALQQQRWDRDYRDNSPVGGRRGTRYENRTPLTGPPSIYNEAPQSTEAGWWNEEKKNYRTTQNRMDRRVYSSGNFYNGESNYMPIANVNVNAERYDVTPDEWKTNSGGINSGNNRYYSDQYGNGRPRQTLRANDRDGRAYDYNNGMPPPYDYQNDRGRRNMANDRSFDYNNNGYNNNFPPPGPPGQQYNNNMNDYNYGFGGQRGQVVGTYNNDNYDPNDVTPAEWQDSKRGYNNNGYNGGYNDRNFNDYRGNYNGNFNDNGLYDPTVSQGGSWWNQESKDYRTNMGRQETRNFGSGPMSNNRNGVTPDEWNDYRGGYRQDGRFGMRPVGYKENVQGPSRQVRSWWDNLRTGFRNVGFSSSRYGSNYDYNGNYRPRYSNYYPGKGPNNRNNRNNQFDRSNFVNVGYNNYNDNGYYGQDNYVNYDYNNGYDYAPRYDNYYDEYSRPEYVTQDRDWWKEENRNYW